MNKKLFLSTALTSVLWPWLAHANPQGGVVVDGSAQIVQETPKTTVINQQSHKATIEWNTFGNQADEHIHFNQPSASSITLNRVMGGDPSVIQGRLTATGNVILVNRNGVYYSKTAVIDVNGIITSTHDISNENFRDGILNFDISGNPNATIVNEGTITIREGGIAVLVAPGVRNAGAIYAKLGKVGIGAANKFTLDLYGDELIVYESDATVLDKIMGPDGKPLADAIRNDGKISAEGGIVIITADVAKGIVDNVINMDGVTQAQTLEQQPGKIVLNGGNSGVVRVAGKLDASGNGEEGKGGIISVKANAIVSEGGTFNVSGTTGGGKVSVGDWSAHTLSVDDKSLFDASATGQGDGGSVIAIAQSTTFSGTVLSQGGTDGGNGGDVETSGHDLDIGGAMINLSAPQGQAGTWLLDPYDLSIDAYAASSISNALSTANVTLMTAANNATWYGTPNPNGSGDININSAISWASNNSLTINAYRNVNVYADLTASGTSPSLIFDPGQGTTGRLAVYSSSSIDLSGASPSLIIDSSSYTLVSSPNELKSINVSGNYALKNDIDLQSISNFTPIGSSSNFTGNFDGLGHKLSNLSINLPSTDSVGLFGTISNNANIRNLHLSSGSVTGRNYVGGIVGQQRYGYLYNVDSAASVTSNGAAAGGLVGYLYAGSINQSYATGNVSGDGAGGLVGIHDGGIYESFSSGNVSGNLSIGGLVGSALAGHWISDSYATGTVSGNSNVGGLVGYTQGSTAQHSSTRNAYSSGLISGTTETGGLVGRCCGFYNYSYNSYWDTETSEQSTSSHGLGLTTAQMKQQSSFTNWDFTNIWQMAPDGYPILRNVSQSAQLPAAPTSEGSVTDSNAAYTWGDLFDHIGDQISWPRDARDEQRPAEDETLPLMPLPVELVVDVPGTVDMGFNDPIKDYLGENLDAWIQNGQGTEKFGNFNIWSEAFGPDATAEYIFRFEIDVLGKSPIAAFVASLSHKETWAVMGDVFVNEGMDSFGRGLTLGLTDGEYFGEISDNFSDNTIDNTIVLGGFYERYSAGEMSTAEFAFHIAGYAAKTSGDTIDATTNAIGETITLGHMNEWLGKAGSLVLDGIESTETGKIGLEKIRNGVDDFEEWAQENPAAAMNVIEGIEIATAIPLVKKLPIPDKFIDQLPRIRNKVLSKLTGSVKTRPVSSVIPGVTAIEINGTTVWDNARGTRGDLIDAALGNNLGHNYPVIDKLVGGVATSIKSVDLRLKTYLDPSKLRNKIQKDLDELYGLGKSKIKDPKTGTLIQPTKKTLELAIPDGVVTKAQNEIIDEMTAYAKGIGLDIIVTVIK